MRRNFCCAFLLALALPYAAAQDYPSKPVKLIVPFPPGGSVDLVARLIGKSLQDELKQPFLVENKPGASGNIGAGQVAKSPADGYTLLVGSAGVFAANQYLYANPPFDPLTAFVPIMRIVDQPNLLVVSGNSPIHSVRELIAAAKAQPGKLTFGSASVGSAQHFATEVFKQQTGVDLLHVPYKGGAPALTDLMGGQIDMLFDTSPTALPYAKSGKLRALAITSAQRSPLLPDVPTMKEAGLPNYEVVTWTGIAAPAGTPAAVVNRINAALKTALKGPLGQQLADAALIPVGDSPEAFRAFLHKDAANYSRLVKSANISLQ
ncbi:tripartite tricarboxylate transporter substrate binding protein [Acidovorax sp. CCYZU-2555]|uniref:Bug family tripartite tricarboxylate transporter substrate binding protein n=1 Tax=Acidovorax sp. CCYZU-2555 TaxID=2835042 RepID=UPI001BCD39B1|nr:tripartite tricarboxylate transporter substrate binding protein [Acidovorax sp. CCYZU-2555]MBS7780367.1 tripartite tricarboxylate transporter substrate binding protein [Acidovorax sp. CCYZU-2555]